MQQNNAIVVGTAKTIFKSTIRALAGRSLTLRNLTISKLQWHASGALYAGTHPAHLFGSDENGRFWQIIDSCAEIVQREGWGIGLIYIASPQTTIEEQWPCNILMNT